MPKNAMDLISRTALSRKYFRPNSSKPDDFAYSEPDDSKKLLGKYHITYEVDAPYRLNRIKVKTVLRQETFYTGWGMPAARSSSAGETVISVFSRSSPDSTMYFR